MTYKITVYSDSMIPMSGKMVRRTFTESYGTEDLDVIRDLISDYSDCAEYDLTDENIKKNMGFEDITPENLAQIRTYYNFRKLLKGDFLKHVSDGLAGIFRYEIPEEVNHFTVRDFPEDSREKEKQFAYYIELSIGK